MLSCQAAIDQENANKSGVSVWDVFKDPVNRRRTILAVAAVNTQAASGAIFMIGMFVALDSKQRWLTSFLAYGTYFFEMAGVGEPFENACILVGVGVFAIIVNTCVITRYGRRRLFLVTGLLICGIMQLIVAVVYTVQPGTQSTGKVIVAMSVIYIVAYNVGLPLLTFQYLC